MVGLDRYFASRCGGKEPQSRRSCGRQGEYGTAEARVQLRPRLRLAEIERLLLEQWHLYICYSWPHGVPDVDCLERFARPRAAAGSALRRAALEQRESAAERRRSATEAGIPFPPPSRRPGACFPLRVAAGLRPGARASPSRARRADRPRLRLSSKHDGDSHSLHVTEGFSSFPPRALAARRLFSDCSLDTCRDEKEAFSATLTCSLSMASCCSSSSLSFARSSLRRLSQPKLCTARGSRKEALNEFGFL